MVNPSVVFRRKMVDVGLFCSNVSFFVGARNNEASAPEIEREGSRGVNPISTRVGTLLDRHELHLKNQHKPHLRGQRVGRIDPPIAQIFLFFSC